MRSEYLVWERKEKSPWISRFPRNQPGQFFEYSNYWELIVLWISTFFSPVTSFKNIWRIHFCSSFFSSIVVKIEASSKQTALSHQGSKIGELKIIQCPMKVSFQGQRNPHICKNLSKITTFKAWDFY